MSIVFCNQKTGYEVRISDWSSDVGSSDLIVARRTAAKLGLPLVPGSDGAVLDVEEAASIARERGYPVLVKAAAGGGGRGMKVAHDPDRKSAVTGKSVSVRVDLGGRRTSKKKKERHGQERQLHYHKK